MNDTAPHLPTMHAGAALPADRDWLRAFDSHALLGAIVLVLGVYYWLIITNGAMRPTYVGNGLTFNSMLEYLLDGRTDIDPNVVRNEGFLREGRVYAYWGIFCALIRLPLLALPHAMEHDVTMGSCLVALCIGLAFKFRSLIAVGQYFPCTPARRTVLAVFALWLAFAGAQVEFLRASIYQEVVFWSGTSAAVATYLVVRHFFVRPLTTGWLVALAMVAGLSLTIRPPIAVGLYIVTMLVALHATWLRAGGRITLRDLFAFRNLAVLAILAALAMVAGIVNYSRWGNPFTFHDQRYYLMVRSDPERLRIAATYGELNLSRVPLSLLYYFVPLWPIVHDDGSLFLDKAFSRIFEVREMPPSSLLLTAAPAFLLGALAAGRAWAGRAAWRPGRAIWLTLGALAVPAVLIMSAMSLTHRYRMEFYPALEFGALLAVAAIASVPSLSRGAQSVLVGTTILAVLASHVTMVMYKLAPFGPMPAGSEAGIWRFTIDGMLAGLHSVWPP